MKKVKIIFSIFSIISLLSCSNSDDNAETPQVVTPGEASLVAPAKDDTCIMGTIVNATESEFEFAWNAGQNATGYTINLTDLKSGNTTTITATETKRIVRLLQNNPYSWSVTSRASGSEETSTSPVWKFYNVGQGIANYAPYPAAITSPQNLETLTGLTTTIEWVGTDADNDIASYDVFLGTTNPPTDTLGNTTNMSIASGNLSLGTTYYLQVVTNDTFGNKTKSVVTKFTTP